MASPQISSFFLFFIFLILKWFCDENRLPGKTCLSYLCDLKSGNSVLPTENVCKEGSCTVFTRSALDQTLFPEKYCSSVYTLQRIPSSRILFAMVSRLHPHECKQDFLDRAAFEMSEVKNNPILPTSSSALLQGLIPA